jgi:hypothetical protein
MEPDEGGTSLRECLAASPLQGPLAYSEEPISHRFPAIYEGMIGAALMGVVSGLFLATRHWSMSIHYGMNKDIM